MRAFLLACPLALSSLGLNPTSAEAGDAGGWGAARTEWSGAYAGLMAGFSRIDAESAHVSGVGRWPNEREFDGLGAGIYGGFVRQTQSGFTFGVEADLYVSGASHDMASRGHGVTKENLPVTSSARVRAGYALGRLHPYLTTGVTAAYYTRENDYTKMDGVLGGLTIGAGLEFAVTERLVARAEYAFTGYMEKDEALVGSGSVVGQTTLATHDARLGLALRF